MRYYVKLKAEEFNAILTFIRRFYLDEFVDILHDVNKGDYFYDYDEQRIIPFEEGLKCIVGNISVRRVAYPYANKKHRDIILSIIETYSIDKDKKDYVKQVNEILDKMEIEN